VTTGSGVSNIVVAAGKSSPSGCTLWVSPDVLVAQAPTAGSVSTQIVFPNTAALVGQVMHQQVVPLELDAQGHLVAMTSSNALSLTLGSF
jgi:hypothetical protein